MSHPSYCKAIIKLVVSLLLRDMYVVFTSYVRGMYGLLFIDCILCHVPVRQNGNFQAGRYCTQKDNLFIHNSFHLLYCLFIFTINYSLLTIHYLTSPLPHQILQRIVYYLTSNIQLLISSLQIYDNYPLMSSFFSIKFHCGPWSVD